MRWVTPSRTVFMNGSRTVPQLAGCLYDTVRKVRTARFSGLRGLQRGLVTNYPDHKKGFDKAVAPSIESSAFAGDRILNFH